MTPTAAGSGAPSSCRAAVPITYWPRGSATIGAAGEYRTCISTAAWAAVYQTGPGRAGAVSRWIAETSRELGLTAPVILIDEEDLDPNFFPDQLIISGTKEIPPWVREKKPQVWDLLNDYPFGDAELDVILREHLRIGRAEPGLVPDAALATIVREAVVRGVTRGWQAAAVTTRALTYAIAEAVIRAEADGGSPTVSEESAWYWSRLADSNWLQHYGSVHDVNCEYLVFDGKQIRAVDPHYRDVFYVSN